MVWRSSTRAWARPRASRAEAAGAAPLLLGGPGYPALLATIADPPPFLWAMGSEALCGRRSVALVGARMVAARRNRQRRAAEHLRLGFQPRGRRGGSRRAKRGAGQLRRQADMGCAL